MKIILFAFTFLTCTFSFSQDKCENKIEDLRSIIEQNKETYSDGAKYVFIKNCKFLIGIGTASTNSKTVSSMSRIASIKARREVSNLINGTKVTSESIMTTEEIISDEMVSYAEVFKDEIKENSIGYVQDMELLTTFKSPNGKTFSYVIFKSF